MYLTAARVARVPTCPGVYTFTRRGVPIYVGKAADLRARLRAYLPGGNWKVEMVREATGLRFERTGSELEALFLEAARISARKPKYNVEQRDERSYLSILITTDEEFPQVMPTRSRRRAGTYFGPFTSARAVRETLQALRKVFPYRCNRPPVAAEPSAVSHDARTVGASRQPRRADGRGKPSAGTASPCLYFHMGLCAGTCAGRITKKEYRRQVIAPLLRVLRGETRAARRLLDPEHRALLDRILAETRVLGTIERFELGGRELQRVLHLPRVPCRIEGYDISHLHGREAVGAMVVAVDGEPDPSQYKRFLIREGQGKSNDPAMLVEVLARRLRHLPALSLRAERSGAKQSDRLRSSRAERGTPLNEQRGPSASPQDDTSCRIASSRTPRNDNDVWLAPDLIVVDGGKPQRNVALRALRAAGVEIPVVALAKRREELYLPGERAPLVLSRHSLALQLLQRVRDEAHRFAISYHRTRYRKRITSS